MAVHRGVGVSKDGDKFWWRIGEALWEFRQWPREGLWRNGLCFTDAVIGNGIKLVEEAVRFSQGFDWGVKNADECKEHDALRRRG
jgi:hypothetical protein